MKLLVSSIEKEREREPVRHALQVKVYFHFICQRPGRILFAASAMR
jgi:hypothetical protein